MNLFTRELKSHRKSLAIWCAVMVAFMFLSMAKYTALSADAAASQQLLQALPSTMQAIFGMTGLSLTTISGYYGICFIFIAVMLAIQAGMLGTELIAKEEADKTAEFLYVKPISRSRALTLKLLSGLVLMAVIYAITYAATVASIAMFTGGAMPAEQLAAFSAALAVIQLTFFALGVFISTTFSVPKRAGALISGLVLVSYVAYILQGLSANFSWLKNLSPFAQFSAQDIIATGSINYGYALICGALAIAAITAGYMTYARRDFTV